MSRLKAVEYPIHCVSIIAKWSVRVQAILLKYNKVKMTWNHTKMLIHEYAIDFVWAQKLHESIYYINILYSHYYSELFNKLTIHLPKEHTSCFTDWYLRQLINETNLKCADRKIFNSRLSILSSAIGWLKKAIRNNAPEITHSEYQVLRLE